MFVWVFVIVECCVRVLNWTGMYEYVCVHVRARVYCTCVCQLWLSTTTVKENKVIYDDVATVLYDVILPLDLWWQCEHQVISRKNEFRNLLPFPTPSVHSSLPRLSLATFVSPIPCSSAEFLPLNFTARNSFLLYYLAPVLPLMLYSISSFLVYKLLLRFFYSINTKYISHCLTTQTPMLLSRWSVSSPIPLRWSFMVVVELWRAADSSKLYHQTYPSASVYEQVDPFCGLVYWNR